MTCRCILLSIFCATSCATASATQLGFNAFNLAQQYLGVTSGGDGGERYREVTRAMAERAIADAQEAGARFLRVAASGHLPSTHGQRSDLDLWMKQPGAYWAAMDAMVAEAGRHRLQLVLTLLWNIRQFPAMVGDSVRDLVVEPESASAQLAARYVTELVARYKGRPEILFYELSNELNLWADLDHVGRCRRRGGAGTGQGAAGSPEAAPDCHIEGNFSTDEMIAFGQRIQRLVHRVDPKARMASGHSAPRRAAEHIRAKPEWVTGDTDFRTDTREQFERNLGDIHTGFDIVSVHVYPDIENARFGNEDRSNLDTLPAAMKVARAVGKPLYLGEFGDPDGQSEPPSSFTSRMLGRIGDLKPEYASPWVWEFYQDTTYRTRDGESSRSSLEPGLTDATIGRFRALSRQPEPAASPASKAVPSLRLVLSWPLRCTRIERAGTVAALASAADGVRWVRFYLDNRLLAQRDAWPYSATLDPAQADPGGHLLRAVVSDKQGRQAERAVPVVVGDGPSDACPQVFPEPR